MDIQYTWQLDTNYISNVLSLYFSPSLVLFSFFFFLIFHVFFWQHDRSGCGSTFLCYVYVTPYYSHPALFLSVCLSVLSFSVPIVCTPTGRRFNWGPRLSCWTLLMQFPTIHKELITGWGARLCFVPELQTDLTVARFNWKMRKLQEIHVSSSNCVAKSSATTCTGLHISYGENGIQCVEWNVDVLHVVCKQLKVL